MKGHVQVGPRDERMSVAHHDPERPADAGVPLVALTLEGLYRAHAPLVARWAAHLGGPSVDVEDVVHEIFIIVRRRLPEFRRIRFTYEAIVQNEGGAAMFPLRTGDVIVVE